MTTPPSAGSTPPAAATDMPEFMAHPDKQDKLLWAAFIAVTIYGFALLPLKPFLLSHPWWSAALTGSRTGLVISGAHASVHGSSWLVPLVLGTLSAMKFMPLWWYMGRKWGREYIDLNVKNYSWLEKRYDSFERFTLRWYPLLLASCYIPGNPLPSFILFLILGESGMRLGRFLLLSLPPIILVQGINVWLGWRFGEPVIEVVEKISKYTLWLTLALVAWILYKAYREAWKTVQKDAAAARETAVIAPAYQAELDAIVARRRAKDDAQLLRKVTARRPLDPSDELHALVMRFRTALEEAHPLPAGMDETAREKVWRYAWQQGSVGGFPLVERRYGDKAAATTARASESS